MPARPKTPCAVPMCSQLVIPGHGGYCDQHQRPKYDKTYEQQRGSSYARGYDRRWVAFRATLLSTAEFALCHDHLVQGQVVAASELHHRLKVVDRPDLKFSKGNIVPLLQILPLNPYGKGRMTVHIKTPTATGQRRGVGTTVTTAGGEKLHGISQITIDIHPDRIVTATLEIRLMNFDGKAESDWVMIHPITRKLTRVATVNFADGSTWPPSTEGPPTP